MIKQKIKISDSDSLELRSENTGKKQRKFKFKRIEIDKRKVYLVVLTLCIILVLLFIRHTRHLDRRPTDVDENPSDITLREDITGKQPVMLKPGKYVAGVDIETGRYTVTAEKGYGSFVIYEAGTRMPEISELLGYFADPAYVPCVTTTLVENQEIEIKGEKLEGITFTPLATDILTELTTGIWVVGLDVRPGTYTISSKDGRSGSVTLIEGDLPIAKVLLGKNGTNFKEHETVTLLEGQIIRISNIPVVLFEEWKNQTTH